MAENQDPSLWELLGVDLRETIPELVDDLWDHILEIATDPDTPAADLDLIPDDDIDTGDADGDDLGLDPVLLGDDAGSDLYGSHHDAAAFAPDGGDDLDPGAADHHVDEATSFPSGDPGIDGHHDLF